MQEEVENKTLTLVINGSKFTGRMFKDAIVRYMAHRKEVIGGDNVRSSIRSGRSVKALSRLTASRR